MQQHPSTGKVAAVIFDLGGVLVSFDNRTWTAPLAREAGVSPELFESVALTGLAVSYHRGDTSLQQYLEGINTAFGMKVTEEEFLGHYRDLFTLRRDTELLVDDLRTLGLKVGLLSNTNDVHWPWCQAQYPVLSRLDGVVVSHLVRTVKPEAAIYRLAAAAVSAAPQDCVFFDDTPTLAKAAGDVGMTGLLFTDAQQARRDLRRLGVQC